MLPQTSVLQRPPAVSAIVPARNEEASIGSCVLSLLEQDEYREVLVADDGSTDGTAAAVRQIAGRDARVRLVGVPPLPPGWVGCGSRRPRPTPLSAARVRTINHGEFHLCLRTCQRL
jgi:glycosyltransferase involved in cell wall biosynthesis